MKWYTLIILAFVLSGCAKSSQEEVNMADIRRPAVAGSWYPGDAESLRTMISEFLDSASVEEINGRVLGLIAPHAGYIYSGPIAAYDFKALMQNKEQYLNNTVILIGFAHRPPSWEGISIWAKGAWETPLGKTPIDEELANKIISYSPEMIQYRRDVHIGEHSLEMELPFLQYVLGDNFKLVPIAFSHQTEAEIETLTNAILAAKIDWQKTIIVVSTDMSHYRPYNDAVNVDQKTLEYVLSGDVNGLVSWMRSGAGAFCGWAGVISAMKIMPKIGATETKLLKYANSGDTQPSTAARGVVGYCAVAYVKPEETGKGNVAPSGKIADEQAPGTDEYSLTEEQKLYLLKLARRTIEELVINGKKYEPPKPDDPKLVEDAPVFVTIHRKKMLRGCIGQMIAQGPLYLAVRDMAIAASSQDYRFQPVGENEINELDIEISVLSPLKRISSLDEIVPFKHGVYIKKGFNTGVFLPQVWGQIPNKDAFLGELCAQKARLPRDCYKNPDTEIYTYTVLKFSESEMGLK